MPASTAQSAIRILAGLTCKKPFNVAILVCSYKPIDVFLDPMLYGIAGGFSAWSANLTWKRTCVVALATVASYVSLFILKNSSKTLESARPKKMIPGRKTDVLDAQWLMRLLACGLLSSSFIPSVQMRALRDLSRYRQDLIDRAGDCLNRMHKVLSLMNVQISLVFSDISGKSATAVIKSIIAGERDAKKLATLVDKGCECTQEELEKAVRTAS